ncbi:cation transporter, partial [Acinetobacter baumannii]|nr:cation transporter [Acinetobacter baumannii]
IAVVLAAVGVFGTGTIFPDLFVAFVIAYLGVSSGYTVIKQSLQERKQSKLMLGSEA